MSQHVQLTLENLKQLDFGKVGAAFDAELAHVVKDCMDRASDRKARPESPSNPKADLLYDGVDVETGEIK